MPTGSLQELLNARIAKLQRDILRTLAWVAVGFLLISAMGFIFMSDATTGLKQVVDIANQIAAGDLEGKSTLHTRKDELGVLGRAVRADVWTP